MNDPTTRISLILRLRQAQDAEAWEEFVELYMPVIQRIASRLGLHSSDAEDPCQEVLIRLSSAVEKWNPGQSGATFKGWLYRVARNTLINYVKAQSVRRSRHARYVDSQRWSTRDNDDADSHFDLEFARQVFVVAANRIKSEFLPGNWSAFWLTYAEQVPIAEAAQRLGIQKSHVYIARCRIVGRLKAEVARMTSDEWELCRSSQS